MLKNSLYVGVALMAAFLIRVASVQLSADKPVVEEDEVEVRISPKKVSKRKPASVNVPKPTMNHKERAPRPERMVQHFEPRGEEPVEEEKMAVGGGQETYAAAPMSVGSYSADASYVPSNGGGGGSSSRSVATGSRVGSVANAPTTSGSKSTGSSFGGVSGSIGGGISFGNVPTPPLITGSTSSGSSGSTSSGSSGTTTAGTTSGTTTGTTTSGSSSSGSSSSGSSSSGSSSSGSSGSSTGSTTSGSTTGTTTSGSTTGSTTSGTTGSTTSGTTTAGTTGSTTSGTTGTTTTGSGSGSVAGGWVTVAGVSSGATSGSVTGSTTSGTTTSGATGSTTSGTTTSGTGGTTTSGTTTSGTGGTTTSGTTTSGTGGTTTSGTTTSGTGGTTTSGTTTSGAGGTTGTPPAPLTCTATPAGGSYSNPVSVSLSCDGAADIYYCVSNGACSGTPCDPSSGGIAYSSAITVGAADGTYCLSFYGESTGTALDSVISDENYIINSTLPDLNESHTVTYFQTTELSGREHSGYEYFWSTITSNNFGQNDLAVGQMNMKSNDPGPAGLNYSCEEIVTTDYVTFPAPSRPDPLFEMLEAAMAIEVAGGFSNADQIDVPLVLADLNYGDNFITTWIRDSSNASPLYSCSTTKVVLEDFDYFQADSSHGDPGTATVREFAGGFTAYGFFEPELTSGAARGPAGESSEDASGEKLETGLFSIFY